MPGVKRVRDNEGEERESENEEGDQESDSERSSLEESISSDGTESDDSSGNLIVCVDLKCSMTDYSGDLCLDLLFEVYNCVSYVEFLVLDDCDFAIRIGRGGV